MAVFSPGTVALITGASGGLGAAVTRAFSEAGAEVIAVARTGSEWNADLTEPRQAAAIVARILDHYHRLDLALHLMGGFEMGGRVEDTTDETWRRMLDVNLNSAFYVFRAALPAMRRAGRGRLLAVGSRTALQPAAGLAAYGVSKAALLMLVSTVALELKGTAITANAVLPSIIDTPANRAAMPTAAHNAWVQPASIASLLLWLASDAAADVNGALIPIYGNA